MASLSQTSQPPAFWKHHRRPTLSIASPLSSDLPAWPRPALRNLDRLSSRAAEPLQLPLPSQTTSKVSTMTLDPRSIPPRPRETLEPALRIQGIRPWPALPKPPQAGFSSRAPEIRRQTPRTYQTYWTCHDTFLVANCKNPLHNTYLLVEERPVRDTSPSRHVASTRPPIFSRTDARMPISPLCHTCQARAKSKIAVTVDGVGLSPKSPDPGRSNHPPAASQASSKHQRRISGARPRR